MPIEQGRLITLIEITTKMADWVNDIKSYVGDSSEAIATANMALAGDEVPRLKSALELCLGQLNLIRNVIADYPLNTELNDKLIEERVHFRLTSKKNDRAKIRMQMVRSGRIQQRPRLTSERIATTDAELSKLWNESEAGAPVTHQPTAEPAAQAPKSGYGSKIIGNNVPSAEELNAPPTKPGSSLL